MKWYIIPSILSASISVLCFSQSVFAQFEQTTMQLPLYNEKNQDIFSMWINYCNDWIVWENTNSKMTINMRPWMTKNVCIAFYNNSPNNHDLLIGFAGWTINKSDNTFVCENNDYDKQNDFYKYIYFTGEVTAVSGNGWVSITNAKIHIPKTLSWDIYGCVWFSLSWWYTQETWSMLGVTFVRRFPIVLHITGSVYNLWRRDDGKELLVNNKATIAKIFVAIFSIWLIVTILKTTKPKPTKKK